MNKRQNVYLNGSGLAMVHRQRGEVIQSQSNIDEHSKHVALCYPFVKWAGGKTQLLPILNKHIPSTFSSYFEPFLGGGAMFFFLFSKDLQFTSYLSDINDELINAYKVVKNKLEELLTLLRNHQTEYEKSPSEYYYQLRANIKPSLTDEEKAARFITLNRTCYNGLYRVNSRGIFNVPMGRYKNPLICDSANLCKVSIALRDSKAKIETGNYKEILLERAREGDFIYLDPPYNPVSDTAYFTRYTHTGFTNRDQEELARVFGTLHDRKCKVMLSNSDTIFIRDLYKDFAKFTKEVDVIRAINSKASKRMGHKELLIRNYP
jgi:DNA adenine methylase